MHKHQIQVEFNQDLSDFDLTILRMEVTRLVKRYLDQKEDERVRSLARYSNPIVTTSIVIRTT